MEVGRGGRGGRAIFDKAGWREGAEECYPAAQLTMKTCSPLHPADISKVAKLISYLTNSSAHSLTSQYFKSRGA